MREELLPVRTHYTGAFLATVLKGVEPLVNMSGGCLAAAYAEDSAMMFRMICCSYSHKL